MVLHLSDDKRLKEFPCHILRHRHLIYAKIRLGDDGTTTHEVLFFGDKFGYEKTLFGLALCPALDLRNEDIAEAEDLGKYDFVVASGIFNAKLMYEDNERHISNTLSRMFDHAGIAAIADFMSTYVDYQKEGAWHSDPANVIGYARKLSRRFILYYDYMPYEFAMVIFKDDLVSNENVFNALIST